MKWLLIVLGLSWNQSGMMNVEFNTEKACRDTKAAILHQVETLEGKDRYRVIVGCFPKGAPE